MTPSTLWLRIHLETRQVQIQACLVAVEDAHNRKPRHAYFGEQI